MNKYNVRGWDHLSGDKSEIVAVRKEVLWQLAEVSGSHPANWEKRLKSKLDHLHFSVRLELYLHHFFKERGWKVDIEPELPNTTNRPDFLLRDGASEILVEAKALLDSDPVAQQDERLKELADRLSKKLALRVHIHPLIDLPPVSLPYGHIGARIEQRATATAVEKWKSGELLKEFPIEGEHLGHPYSLEVTIIPSPTSGVGGWVTQAHEDNTGNRIREAIKEKAKKYGKPGIPFVIAVWPKMSFYMSGYPSHDDYVALFGGDELWTVTPSGGAESQFGLNGVFYFKNDNGTRRYSHVSAVALYLFRYDTDPPYTGRSLLRVYHNPFADYRLNSEVFRGVPQGFVNFDSDKLQWVGVPI